MSAGEFRSSLRHPVIDVDGHVIEYLAAVEPYLFEMLGRSAICEYYSKRKRSGFWVDRVYLPVSTRAGAGEY
jgi:hypothetical protein